MKLGDATVWSLGAGISWEQGLLAGAAAIGLIALLCIPAWRIWKRLAGAARRGGASRRRAASGPAPASELDGTLSGLVGQLETLAARIDQQIAERCATLEALTRAADERIARLNALTADTAEHGQRPEKRAPSAAAKSASKQPARDGAKSATKTAENAATRPATADQRVGGPPRRRGALSRTRTVVQSQVAPGGPDGAAPDGPEPTAVRRVYELADAGQPPITIAEALDLAIGEVELILNLRQFAAAGQ